MESERISIRSTPSGWYLVSVHRPSMLYGETTHALYVGRDHNQAWAYYLRRTGELPPAQE